MAQDFKLQKRAIIAGVSVLLLADIALAAYSWQLSTKPTTPAQQIATEMGKLKLQKADIEYAEQIAANFPKTRKDCDKFESELPQAATASSTISAELGEVSKKAGVQLTGVTFRDKEAIASPGQKVVQQPAITEREIEATVSGGYENVVRFLNGLQKSPNYYVVDSLDLGSESNAPNVLHVSLHMRTFYRTAGA
jgi:hypothetical protein